MTALPTGDWTYTEGDKINGRPIYRKTGGNYVMSVATVGELIQAARIVMFIARTPESGGW